MATLPAKFKPYSHSVAVGVVAVALGMVSKYALKRETLPVGSIGKTAMTFALVTVSSILGEEAMFQARTNEIIK